MARGINTKGPEKARRESRDLTQLVSELEAAKAYKDNIFNSMLDGVLVANNQGAVVDVNDAVARMCGYTKEEILSSSPSTFWAERDIPRVVSAMAGALAGTPFPNFEMSLVTKDAVELPVSVTANLVRDAQGNPTALVVVLRDIRETKKLISDLEQRTAELQAANEELRATEEELRATNEELEAANEELREAQEELVRSEKLAAVGQLASGIGHELRNPLGAIKNAVFYVKRRLERELGATEPRILEFLDIMDSEVDAANKVISDLLGFTRVAKPVVSPTKVQEIIENASKYLHLPENVELVVEPDKELPLVLVDADQIRQVFTNIMLNAQEAMPEGGKLTIAAQAKGEFVEVKFTDTGCGIPDSTIRKIFDPLFTTKAKGVGLGLSVCQSIVERHGGSIRVGSEVDKGTTFSVLLPLVPSWLKN